MDLSLRKVTIRLRSGIHLGEREGWMEGTEALPQADTLFSAFCNGYRLLYGSEALTGLLQSFRTGRVPFRISSAFPQWDGRHFFPVPLNQLPAGKEIKKIHWVEQEGFHRLLRNEELASVVEAFPDSCLPRPKAAGAGLDTAPTMPWQIMEVPRIGLDRTHAHPGDRYFHFGETWFRPEAAFFFLAEVADEGLWKEFQSVWRILADEGIGGDRTVGKGLYHDPSFGALTLDVPNHADGQLLLSPFYPTASDMPVLMDGYYEFMERKGYVYSPMAQGLRRQGVRLLKCGSVFRSRNPLAGMLVPVTPGVFEDHEVYRYGIAMTVPCLLTGGRNAGSASD